MKYRREPVYPPSQGRSTVTNERFFLGVRFDTMNHDATLQAIMAQTKQPSFRYVVTPNIAHMVAMLEQTTTVKPFYDQAWLCVNDSRVLRRLAKLSHSVDLPVYPGSDMTKDVLAQANRRAMSVAIIGAHEGDARTLAAQYPEVKLSYCAAPKGLKDSEDARQKCVEFTLAADADLVLFAVGMPQQEMIAAEVMAAGTARGVGLCVGASIDFLTKRQIRAPEWMQRTGLEWLHRLLCDPRRLARRYLIDCPKILFYIWRDRLRR